MPGISISYLKNENYGPETPDQPRLYARLDLRARGLEGTAPLLPIYYREPARPQGAIRVIYSTVVGGLKLETGNLQRLEELIAESLEALILFDTLPAYVFQVGGTAWPIYRLEDQLVTRYSGGPVFSAANVADLREWLASHFKSTGRVENRKDLNVLFFSPYDLQLYPPLCMIRALEGGWPDIPVYPDRIAGGLQLRAALGFENLCAPHTPEAGLLALFRQVGDRLVAAGRVRDPFDLSIRKLEARHWQGLVAGLERNPWQLSYFRKGSDRFYQSHLEVFRFGGVLYTGRSNRFDRYTVYAAADIQSLRQKVGRDMVALEGISAPTDIQVAAAHTPEKTPAALDRVLQASTFEERITGGLG